jgi:hypothetical protein
VPTGSLRVQLPVSPLPVVESPPLTPQPVPAVEPPPPPAATPDPLPVITDGPHGRIKAPAVTFTVAGPESADLECTLDSATWAECTGEVSYDELGEGWHTFAVRVVDSETAVTRRFLVKLPDTGRD